MNISLLASLILMSSLFTTGAELTNSVENLIKEINPSTKTNPLATSFTLPEYEVHKLVNAHRTSRGLKPLASDSRIIEQARLHSQNMASGLFSFGHQNFSNRIQRLSRTMSISASAENVAYNRGYEDIAGEAFKGWINSPGHKKNIEGDFTHTGIGVAKSEDGRYYLTQIFVKVK